MGRRHIPELDGLRGLAIVLVIAYHFQIQGEHGIRHAIHWMTGFWWTGVDLFFALSGFLITGILLDAARGPRMFRNFYARRCLRILPLYYLSLVVWFWLMPAFSGAPVAPWRDQLWYWFHLSNWPSAYFPSQYPWLTQFWSLAIEEQFYLLWPLVVLLCRRRTTLWTALGLIAISVALRNLTAAQETAHVYRDFIYRLTPFRVDTLLMGGVAAIAYRDDALRGFAKRRSWAVGAAGASVAIACMAADHSMSAFTEWTMRLGYTGSAVFWASVVMGAAMRTGSTAAATRLMRSGVLRTFGKYSYCLYVIHPAVLAMRVYVFDYLGAVLSDAAAVGAMLGVAMVSWYAFERHFLKLQARFRERTIY